MANGLGATLDKFRLIGRLVALSRHDRWPRETLLKYQARRLEDLRRFALARSPFYRRFHRGLESAPLTRLPVLTKEELMQSFDEVVTTPAVNRSGVHSTASRCTESSSVLRLTKRLSFSVVKTIRCRR